MSGEIVAAYEKSPTTEENLRPEFGLDTGRPPVESDAIQLVLKKVVGTYSAHLDDTIEAEAKFMDAVREVKNDRYQVEYLHTGDTVVVILRFMGEKLGKTAAKNALQWQLAPFGGAFRAYPELELRAAGSLGQAGELSPDISVYPADFRGAFRGSSPSHPLIAVQISWVEDWAAALTKANLYFAASFVAPDSTAVREVWNLFLARAVPAVPTVLTNAPVHTETLPFGDFAEILTAAAALGEYDPTIMVFHHRDRAYAPSYGLLRWNTALAVPVNSVFTERLDCNAILSLAYQGT